MAPLRAALFVQLVAGARAANVPVSWVIPMSPQTMSVNVGDTVVFTWGGNHNVWLTSQSEFDQCRGGSEIAGTDVNTYRWSASSAGTFYFICEVGGHCDAGQKIAITVATASPPTPPLPPPPAAPPPPTEASSDNPCFPSTAKVAMADGSLRRVDALKAGDQILAVNRADGARTTDIVSALSLADPAAEAAFLTLTTTAGNLTLTASHHVPIGAVCCSVLKTAAELRAGDALWKVAGGAAIATSIIRVTKATHRGLHSPVLVHGNHPVVDGFVTAFDSAAKVTFASYALPLLEATGMTASFRRAFLEGDQKRKYIA